MVHLTYVIDGGRDGTGRCVESNLTLIVVDNSTQNHQSPRISTSRAPHSWKRVPIHIPSSSIPFQTHLRAFSSTVVSKSLQPPSKDAKLTHVTPAGTAQMVSISHKSPTARLATAVCNVFFSTPDIVPLIRANQLKKGDVLAVARIAGIMAAKRTPDLIPLCHPISISHVSVDLETIARDEAAELRQSTGTSETDTSQFPEESAIRPSAKVSRGLECGLVAITATVSCDGKTGVEMEALMAANVAALTVYDMCKAVDKGIRIDGLRVVRKEGGKTGLWVDGKNIED